MVASTTGSVSSIVLLFWLIKALSAETWASLTNSFMNAVQRFLAGTPSTADMVSTSVRAEQIIINRLMSIEVIPDLFQISAMPPCFRISSRFVFKIMLKLSNSCLARPGLRIMTPMPRSYSADAKSLSRCFCCHCHYRQSATCLLIRRRSGCGHEQKACCRSGWFYQATFRPADGLWGRRGNCGGRCSDP